MLQLIAKTFEGTTSDVSLSQEELQHVHAEFMPMFEVSDIEKVTFSGPMALIDDIDVIFERTCTPDSPFYVRWINRLGGWEYHMFALHKIWSDTASPSFSFQPVGGEKITATRTREIGAIEYTETVEVGETQLDIDMFRFLKSIITSPNVQHWNEARQAWEGVTLTDKTTASWNTKNSLGQLTLKFTLIDQRTQF